MHIYILFLFLFSSSFANLYSQNDRSKILVNKVPDPEGRVDKILNDLKMNKAEAIKLAKEKGLDTTNISGLDPNGNIIYLEDYNVIAASTTNTSSLHTGGILGLDLNGLGFTIGQWESGIPLSTHENLSLTAVGDSETDVTEHATHVAGTLIGNGINDSAAKGMAPQANILSHNFNADTEEMEDFASDGWLISNHSYGAITGWWRPNSSTPWRWLKDDGSFVAGGEDINFGRYGIEAKAWDEVSYYNPNYLIVKASGNDRNDNPNSGSSVLDPDSTLVAYDITMHPLGDGVFNGGYETIALRGTAKNILTIGAIDGATGNSMSSFSGWGPTDDGRLKPDLVGHGVDLYSSEDDSNNDYDTKSGTSMASPNVAGSAVLLQEHYENLNGSGEFMESATLKALMIHTATDLDIDGPDFKTGWGLLNTESAANLISEDSEEENYSVIIESALSNLGGLGNYSYSFYTDGCYNPKVTLAWTDVAGTSQSGLNSTNPNLVNDLDLEIEKGNIDFFPYVLDATNPTNPATTGDNILDNVEQIRLQNSGIYKINVDFKGSLEDPTAPINALAFQGFSLIINGIEGVCNYNTSSHSETSNISEGTYCYDSEFTSDSSLSQTDEVHYRSNEKIKLLPGFKAINGSILTAKITSSENCPPVFY